LNADAAFLCVMAMNGVAKLQRRLLPGYAKNVPAGNGIARVLLKELEWSDYQCI